MWGEPGGTSWSPCLQHGHIHIWAQPLDCMLGTLLHAREHWLPNVPILPNMPRRRIQGAQLVARHLQGALPMMKECWTACLQVCRRPTGLLLLQMRRHLGLWGPRGHLV